MYYIIYICNKILLVSHPSPKIGIYWNSCSEVRPRQLFWWPNFREAALQKSGFPLSLSLSSPSKAFLPGWAHVATTLCPLPPSIQGGGVNMQSATSGYESNESNLMVILTINTLRTIDGWATLVWFLFHYTMLSHWFDERTNFQKTH